MAHTPGPLFVFENGHCIGGPHKENGTAGVAMCAMRLRDDEENSDNTRLLTAAFNSYDRNCGANAVQLAEEDLLGQALELLQDAASSFEGTDCDLAGYAQRNLLEEITKILNKAKGA